MYVCVCVRAPFHLIFTTNTIRKVNSIEMNTSVIKLSYKYWLLIWKKYALIVHTICELIQNCVISIFNWKFTGSNNNLEWNDFSIILKLPSFKWNWKWKTNWLFQFIHKLDRANRIFKSKSIDIINGGCLSAGICCWH